MTLVDRIKAYILNHYPISYTKLVAVATSKGFSEVQVLTALEAVHRDKTITQTTKKGEIWYSAYVEPVATPQPHLDWIKNNYVRPHHCEHGMEHTSCEHCMPFPTISYSHLFLKPAEMAQFKIEQRGGYRPKTYRG